jgi:hypothetical protein
MRLVLDAGMDVANFHLIRAADWTHRFDDDDARPIRQGSVAT